MENDTVLYSIAGGAIITAALTFARVLLDYGARASERRADADDRRRQLQRDADARLERLLQDQLAEAERRLERLQQAHDLLVQQFASLKRPTRGRSPTRVRARSARAGRSLP